MRLISSLLGLLLLIAEVASAFDLLPPPYRFEAIHRDGMAPSYESMRAFALPHGADANAGFAHVIVSIREAFGQPRTRVMLYNESGRLLDQCNLSAPRIGLFSRDLVGDGRNEVMAVLRDQRSTGLILFDDTMRTEYGRFFLYGDDFPELHLDKWDVSFEVGPEVPGVLDGAYALPIAVYNGFGHAPRGLYMVNPLSGDVLWTYRIAAAISSIELIDVDGDERPEIIYGCTSGDNKVTVDGTSDDHSYLGVLDRFGRQLWRREFPGPFGRIQGFAGHARSRGGAMIIALFSPVHPGGGDGYLAQVDAITGETIKHVGLDEHLLGGGVDWGTDSVGRREILVSFPYAGVAVYNEDLERVRGTSTIDAVRTVGDIDGDGEKEVLGTRGDLGTLLLDHDLEVMATCSTSFIWGPTLHRLAGQTYADMLGTTESGIYRFRLDRNPARTMALIKWLGLFLLLPATVISVYAAVVARLRVIRLQAQAEHERYQAWAAMARKLAHDVGMPLNVLRLSAQNLEQELSERFGGVPERIGRYFQTFREEADRLLHVSRSFMTFARETPPRLEPTDLAALLRKAVERRPHPEGVIVDFDPPPDLPLANVDAAQILTVADNLLSNSYHAMPQGGTMTIRARWDRDLHAPRRDGGSIVLEFADTGCGIAPVDLPRIFDPYFSRSEGGTGIGLVLVKKIVEDHAGRITADSIKGSGTTFILRLPVLVTTETQGNG